MKNNQSLKIAFSILICILFFGCETSKPKPIIEIPEGKIGMIGYGSLTSRNSVEDILGRRYEDSLYFVHLENFKRTWTFVGNNNDPNLPGEMLKYDSFYLKAEDTVSFKKSMFLNITPEDGVDVNCVLYFITIDELDKFDDMELGYARIDVTSKIREYDFKGGRVVAYKALPEYLYNPEKDKDITIVDKSYYDMVMEAYDEVGDDYRREFDNSTEAIDTNMVAPVIRIKKKDSIGSKI